MHEFLRDLTLGQILNFGAATFGLLTLIYSGKAARGVKTLGAAMRTLNRSVGHPDPAKASPTTGKTLTQKVETQADKQEAFQEGMKWNFDKLRAQQIEFIQEVLYRLNEVAPPTGKRAKDD